jgi:hypothetical protein
MERGKESNMPQGNKDTIPPEDKSLRVVTYWLFVVAVFAWVIPFTLLFVFKLMEAAGDTGAAIAGALWPSLYTFVVAAILCVVAYYIYKKLILRV